MARSRQPPGKLLSFIPATALRPQVTKANAVEDAQDEIAPAEWLEEPVAAMPDALAD